MSESLRPRRPGSGVPGLIPGPAECVWSRYRFGRADAFAFAAFLGVGSGERTRTRANDASGFAPALCRPGQTVAAASDGRKRTAFAGPGMREMPSMDYRSTLRRAACALLLAAVPFGLVAPVAADWTGFRGPKNLGLSDERGLPAEWSGTKNVVWKVKLPGPGSSNPITTGGRIFLTCCTGYGTGSGGDPKDL